MLVAWSDAIRLMAHIDRVIDQHGGWPWVFAMKGGGERVSSQFRDLEGSRHHGRLEAYPTRGGWKPLLHKLGTRPRLREGDALRGNDTSFAGTRTTRTGLQSARETASDTRTVFEDSYVEEVDRAIEQFAVAPSGV